MESVTEERGAGAEAEKRAAKRVPDAHVPVGKWEFDESVTACFDDMLDRSIPQYEVMRDAVKSIAISVLKTREKISGKTVVVDLGASVGGSIRDIYEHMNMRTEYHLIEVSKPMVAALTENFKDCPEMEVHEKDIRHWFPHVTADVVLSVFTLQFVPINYRQEIVRRIYDALPDGGAFIFVEKVLGNTGTIDDMTVTFYHQMKKKNGYSDEDIERKRMSLEGVLVPLTSKWNNEMLEAVGFRKIDTFWRWMNFAGIVAIK